MAAPVAERPAAETRQVALALRILSSLAWPGCKSSELLTGRWYLHWPSPLMRACCASASCPTISFHKHHKEPGLWPTGFLAAVDLVLLPAGWLAADVGAGHPPLGPRSSTLPPAGVAAPFGRIARSWVAGGGSYIATMGGVAGRKPVRGVPSARRGGRVVGRPMGLVGCVVWRAGPHALL